MTSLSRRSKLASTYGTSSWASSTVSEIVCPLGLELEDIGAGCAHAKQPLSPFCQSALVYQSALVETGAGRRGWSHSSLHWACARSFAEPSIHCLSLGVLLSWPVLLDSIQTSPLRRASGVVGWKRFVSRCLGKSVSWCGACGDGRWGSPKARAQGCIASVREVHSLIHLFHSFTSLTHAHLLGPHR